MVKDLTILQGRLKYIFRQPETEGTNPLGQQLANELNTTVKAPNEFLWFSSNGRLTPMGMKADRSQDTSKPGTMRIFTPQSKK